MTTVWTTDSGVIVEAKWRTSIFTQEFRTSVCFPSKQIEFALSYPESECYFVFNGTGHVPKRTNTSQKNQSRRAVYRVAVRRAAA